jgi:antirestriction protein ArdC
MKGCTVFNVEQIEGLPVACVPQAPAPAERMPLIEDAGSILRRDRRRVPGIAATWRITRRQPM